MKKNLHPITRPTVFQDVTTGDAFLVDSTVETGDVVMWLDGQSYPLVKVEISSSSHSAYIDEPVVEKTSTRAEKFNKKYTKSFGNVH